MAAARKYSGWSLDKLRAEKAKIEKAIDAREGEGRTNAIRAIKDAVRKSGFELSELIDDLRGGNSKRGPGRPAGKKKSVSKKKARGKRTGKVPPKYQNPKDSSMTWTGRGRAPVWVREHEEKHGNRNALLIK